MTPVAGKSFGVSHDTLKHRIASSNSPHEEPPCAVQTSKQHTLPTRPRHLLAHLQHHYTAARTPKSKHPAYIHAHAPKTGTNPKQTRSGHIKNLQSDTPENADGKTFLTTFPAPFTSALKTTPRRDLSLGRKDTLERYKPRDTREPLNDQPPSGISSTPNAGRKSPSTREAFEV